MGLSASVSPAEEWRPVVGYEGLYEVSDLGRVRTLERTREKPHWRGGPYTVPARMRKLQVSRTGYLMVGLSGRGRWRCFPVHRLVMAAFVGPLPEGKVTNHKNGDTLDARLVNLEYVTQLENVRHARDVLGKPVGTMRKAWPRLEPIRSENIGEGHAFSTLTNAAVREMRAAYAAGTKQRDLARRFGTSVSNVCRIVTYRAWKHV